MKYNFTATRCRFNDTIYWVGKSELDGCVAQSKTLEDMLKELEQNEQEWVNTAQLYNIDIPNSIEGE